jgi:hypothetical protein
MRAVQDLFSRLIVRVQRGRSKMAQIYESDSSERNLQAAGCVGWEDTDNEVDGLTGLRTHTCLLF